MCPCKTNTRSRLSTYGMERSALVWLRPMAGRAATWAVLLTLLAIAEQTAIANKTLVATLRPHLIVRKSPSVAERKFPLRGNRMLTRGNSSMKSPTSGKEQPARYSTDFRPTVLMSLCLQKSVKGIATRCRLPCNRGKSKELSIPIDEQLVSILRLVGSDGLRNGYQNTDKIWFFGTACYSDGNGIKRNLSVCRSTTTKPNFLHLTTTPTESIAISRF